MKIMQGPALRRWERGRFLSRPFSSPHPPAYSEIGSDGGDDSGTLLGNYLSGRMARGDHDLAAAAEFYSRALAEDPKNEMILEQAFLLDAASAHWDSAVKLAKDLVKTDSTNRLAPFPARLRGLQARPLRGGRRNISPRRARARSPISPRRSPAPGCRKPRARPRRRFATLDSLSDADWAQFYQRYHRALIADLAGKRDVARQAYAQAFKKNPSPSGSPRLMRVTR